MFSKKSSKNNLKNRSKFPCGRYQIMLFFVDTMKTSVQACPVLYEWHVRWGGGISIGY